ncbi:hypothetical protein [Streptomyces sp. NRRL WC-3742]|uniref:hypothetical protein n=1 Tax=Streptomyces sp. NRRL WC-3742 TaxID=1463934 RepID=UPI0004C5BA62|nr:hypothetical protein [Streptomyces sp. NRRL WC-3742]
MTRQGLRVTVEGDLPHNVLERIGDSVRRAVLDEVAELDLAPPLREVPSGNAGSARDAVDALIHRPGPIGIVMAPEK